MTGLLAALGLAFASVAGAEPVSKGPMSIELTVPHAPVVAAAGGHSYLVYELHITNFVPGRTMHIRSVDVVGGDEPAKRFARYDSLLLKESIRYIGDKPQSAQGVPIPSSARVILFLWVPLRSGDSVPARLKHVVNLAVEGVERVYEIDGEEVDVSKRTLVRIGKPLRSGSWVAANGPHPRNVPAHNRLLYPKNGRMHLPQRFATDWIKLDVSGRVYRGSVSHNDNYASFGEAVLAVADGKVVETLGDVRDNVPPDVDPKQSQRDRAGNFIVLDIGGGNHAFYGHLKQGSLNVKAGQRVKRGDVLGLVGNSGNSTGAHLHFHVTNGPSFGSEGVPFTFDRYQLLGNLAPTTLDDLDKGVAWPGGKSPRAIRDDLPLGGQVVRF